MRVLVFHGYLLRGTGSNVYTANLAAALVRLGHEVHLVCQERHAAELSFVGAVGDWDTGELELRRVSASPCTVYRPNIGEVLPVYVLDRYEGLEARLFPDLSDAELDAYLQANVGAVAEVAVRAHPDVALANHLVMGPAILARALSGTGVPCAAKIHGSALEYTVKPYPRFLPHAREGIRAARGVLVGSRHTAESLWSTLQEPRLPARTRLGPPGVDLSAFRPLGREGRSARLRVLAARVSEQARRTPSSPPGHAPVAQSAFARDDDATGSALLSLSEAAEADPLVAFVGKLIVSKGIDLLVLAWPLVLAAVPTARLAVVGFGAYRSAAEQLVAGLSDGDLTSVNALLAIGRGAEAGPAGRLPFASAFLDSLEAAGERESYLAAARDVRERVTFTGRLEHDELAVVLPLCEALVVPSTFPEAFGMVAVEAAACGVLPISAAHSGLLEVSRILGKPLDPRIRQLLSFSVGPSMVRSMAECTIGWLRTPPELRAETRSQLVDTAAARYSWDAVARGVIAAARGELDALEPPA
jgi:glycosyltransferase involved in cell wall biosynthesis